MKQLFKILGIAFAGALSMAANAHAQGFVYGVVTKQITLNGYDLSSDSYNSAEPARSTGGLYDPAKAGDLGNVWAEAGILNSVGVGNVSIWGKLAAGSSYSLEIGPASSIGSAGWHQSGQTGIEPSYLETGLVWQFPDVPLPYTTWLEPVAGIQDGEAYTYVLGSGDYKLSSLNLSGNEKLLVTGAARLYVSDELNLKGNAAIRILPEASLKLFAGAGTVDIRGAGILNEGVAGHFLYYGLGSNRTINLRLTASFVALLYAPRAVCYVTTKGNTIADMQGAFIVQELDLGAPLRLHYDEAVAGGTPR